MRCTDTALAQQHIIRFFDLGLPLGDGPVPRTAAVIRVDGKDLGIGRVPLHAEHPRTAVMVCVGVIGGFMASGESCLPAREIVGSVPPGVHVQGGQKESTPHGRFIKRRRITPAGGIFPALHQIEVTFQTTYRLVDRLVAEVIVGGDGDELGHVGSLLPSRRDV